MPSESIAGHPRFVRITPSQAALDAAASATTIKADVPDSLVRWYPRCPYCGVICQRLSDCCCPQFWPTICDAPGCANGTSMSRLYRGASMIGRRQPNAGSCETHRQCHGVVHRKETAEDVAGRAA